jgi:hypothetical protein
MSATKMGVVGLSLMRRQQHPVFELLCIEIHEFFLR